MDDMQKNIARAKVVNCACFNLRKAARAITQHFDRALQPSGLRCTQFTILALAANANAMTITRMAKQLVMDRTTLTRNLRPLERRGFIRIVPGDDLRTRYVSLAENGRHALHRALPLWETAQRQLEQGLGDDRYQHLLSDLSETTNIARNA